MLVPDKQCFVVSVYILFFYSPQRSKQRMYRVCQKFPVNFGASWLFLVFGAQTSRKAAREANLAENSKIIN